jgi:hypothetical protein
MPSGSSHRLSVSRVAYIFLTAAICTLLGSVLPVRAVEPTAAPASLADGIWTVQGRDRCGGWVVRLTNEQGKLSGVISLTRSSASIRNLVLERDGSFSGTARASLARPRRVRIYRITGTFSGDMVNLTLEDNFCPPRHGTATRRPTGSTAGVSVPTRPAAA